MTTAGRMVTVEATPTSLNIDLSKTAALVIDMQNDFGAKAGMFDRAGIDVSVIQRAVKPTAQVLASARAAGVPVIYIKEEHRPDSRDVRLESRMRTKADVHQPL
jgi:ureidoacrylate peracid hydrolase